ncbi:MAG: translation initiation factor IF-6 [Candidatus Diapherotrites archaeon]|jgi:translation initiation factor 6|uniref:Translation initiation factor IF-6 n=1 Tax=Candidatus Iainarchaeum sp. TaxID=3101447 RepID=A0A8T5GDM3_9ARCH|nr:translation initiation factor IF-6 [Candidatus Diapherotrites archaeon]MBT7241396.1 translation initiation factor IF-6 [Candidatus Diapherotrites archaeon]
MKVSKTRILGSSYVGLFGLTNNELCIVARGTDAKVKKDIEEVLDVKTIEAGIYDSNLLAVFAKMNNKEVYLPSYALGREIEAIEKEIKVKIIQTEQALGNLLEVNDTHAVVSKTLQAQSIEALQSNGLKILQENIAQTDAIGSSLLLLNNSFVINPNATEEEVKKIQETLNIRGGSATANTGDSFVRNSVIANEKGFIVGDQTTGHELNRIEEALEG